MQPIGFFDSGVGGLTVMCEARRLLPQEDFIFLGDNLHAPYGPRPVEEIRHLTIDGVNRLLRSDIKALVIACNTATSACVNDLRRELTIPVIGIEPALKPAHFLRHGGKIIVLATYATLHLEKFSNLMALYGEGAEPVVGEELVELVESGRADSPEAVIALEKLFAPYRNEQIDAIVLGCTHYPLLKKSIQHVMKDVPILDGGPGTAKQLQRVLERENLLEMGGGKTIFLSTGGEKHTDLMKKLWCEMGFKA